MKSKVIHAIIESCREEGPQGARVPAAARRRSPAAGGGLAGAVPPIGAAPRKDVLRDPRLGQSVQVRLPRRRRTRRS